MSEAIITPPSLHAVRHHRRSPSEKSSAGSLSFSLLHPYFIKSHLLSVHPVRIRPLTWFRHSHRLESQFQELDDAPASVKLEPIAGEAQFDRIVAEAQQLEEPLLVVWMAGWCRKCIYLKPKLETLAAHYYPRIRFYCVDVNSVPQRLVDRAGVTKMPTIQLWRDGKKQAEVIGGHKAWLVVNEVHEMIENES